MPGCRYTLRHSPAVCSICFHACTIPVFTYLPLEVVITAGLSSLSLFSPAATDVELLLRCWLLWATDASVLYLLMGTLYWNGCTSSPDLVLMTVLGLPSVHTTITLSLGRSLLLIFAFFSWLLLAVHSVGLTHVFLFIGPLIVIVSCHWEQNPNFQSPPPQQVLQLKYSLRQTQAQCPVWQVPLVKDSTSRWGSTQMEQRDAGRHLGPKAQLSKAPQYLWWWEFRHNVLWSEFPSDICRMWV